MSPAGRLESHQRGFWIETLFQMQKTKALSSLFPECVRRVEKQSTKAGRFLFFGVHAQEVPGGKPEIWLTLPIRSLPHDLVTGGTPHAGSQHYLTSLDCHRTPGWAPCFTQQILTGCLFHKCNMYVSTLLSQSVHPLLSHCVRKSVFYVCVFIAALQTGSSVPSF